MEHKKVFKKTAIFIIFILCLFIQNYSFAIDATNTDQQSSPVVEETNNSAQTEADKNDNLAAPKKDDNAIFTKPVNTVKVIPQANNKTFDFLKSSPTEPAKKLTATPNSRYTITFRGRSFDFKKHLHLTTLIAIVGLTGTFFGLFSTWLIYHLNKKHNNPLLIDKHNSAIKYMDDLNIIKLYLASNDAKKLYSVLHNIDKYPKEEIQRLIIYYEDICKSINKVDLTGIHTRYEKHIKKSNNDIFNCLITNYRMIKIDGFFLSTSSEDYHMFNPESLRDPNNLNSLKTKTIMILTFEEQIDIVLKILRKELKL